jgi:hypothetical protein
LPYVEIDILHTILYYAGERREMHGTFAGGDHLRDFSFCGMMIWILKE